MEIAQRVWITKRLFNIKQYEDEKPIDYDVLPKRFMNEPLPSGRAKGSKAFISEEDYSKSLQLLHEKRGFDENGVLTRRRDKIRNKFLIFFFLLNMTE